MASTRTNGGPGGFLPPGPLGFVASLRPSRPLLFAPAAALAAVALAASGPAGSPLGVARAQAQQGGTHIAVASQELSGGRFREVPTFEWDARPGQTLYGRVFVRNQSRSRAATVAVVPVSSAISENFAPAYTPAGEPLRPPATWVKMTVNNQNVPPRQSRGFQFTVEVPSNARTGDNVSGFSVTQTNQETQEVQSADSELVITQRTRFALINNVQIPGPRKPALGLFDPKLKMVGGKLVSVFKARNRGNAILTGLKGWARLSRGGSVVMKQPIDHGTIWPKTTSNIRSERSDLRPRGGDMFNVKAEVRYEGGVARLEESITFGKKQEERQTELFPGEQKEGLPWWAWALIALAAAALLGALLAEHLRRRRLLLSSEKGSALLERELRAIPETGAPVSAIALSGLPADRKSKRSIAKALRPRLGAGGRLCDPGDGRLLVIASDTGQRAAIGLEDEVRRWLRAHELVDSDALQVGVATATEPMTATQLVEAASDADGAHGPDQAPRRGDGVP